jgi:hypothetical protein
MNFFVTLGHGKRLAAGGRDQIQLCARAVFAFIPALALVLGFLFVGIGVSVTAKGSFGQKGNPVGHPETIADYGRDQNG